MFIEFEGMTEKVSSYSTEKHFPDILQHPKYQEICRCHCGSPEIELQTFQVYMDLAESKGWWNLQINKISGVERVVISGHQSCTASRDYIVPVDSNTCLSHADIQTLIEGVQTQCNSDSVILALIDDNSSIIYYRATGDLCPPDPAETVESKHAKSRRLFERRKTRVQKLKESMKSFGHASGKNTTSVDIPEGQDHGDIAVEDS